MTTLNLFQHATDVVAFDAGQVIFDRGQPGDVMYVVQQGEVDILLQDTVIDTVGPGGIVGEMALIDASPRSATVVAKTECRLVPVDKKRFTFMIQQTPYFALYVMEVMAHRLRRLHDQAG